MHSGFGFQFLYLRRYQPFLRQFGSLIYGRCKQLVMPLYIIADRSIVFLQSLLVPLVLFRRLTLSASSL